MGEMMKKIITLLILSVCFTGCQTTGKPNDKVFKFRLGGIQSKIASNFTKKEPKKLIKRNYLSPKFSNNFNFSKITRDHNNIAFIFYDGANVVEENYNHGATPETPLFVYSISKSFTGIMLLHSMCQNNIDSLDTKIGNVSQRLKNTIYGSVTIRNALKMQSGVGKNFSKKQKYPMWKSFITRKKNPIDWIIGINETDEQGKIFQYNANDTNALGIILEDITGRNILGNLNYLFLKYIDLSGNVYWQFAKNGEYIGAYGLMANAYDIIQLGKRFLQILDENKCVANHFDSMMDQDRSDGKYGFQVWIHHTQRGEGKRRFFGSGHGGQRLIMDRDDGSVALIYSLNQKYEFGEVHDEFYRVKYK